MKLIWLVAAALALCACSKQVQNADAVKQGVMEHLRSRSDFGLNLDAMDIQVSKVSFREKEADAVVAFVPKNGPQGSGMSMNYKMALEGDKWVVKDKSMANMPGAGAAVPPVAGGQAPQLPAGHVPVAPKGK